ncbi:MAG: ABC transporter substrate-binding protein [Marinilabiliales bacterium]|nr:ABC transporter substrate-binding protein [Marinilabiliales bacterium]
MIDPATFEIRWVRPCVSGLYILGMYYCKILPKDLLESQGRGFFNKPVGTGPFKFEEWIRSPRLEILGVRLERNPDYFERRPYLAALEYSPYYTDAQFEEGSVHLVSVTTEKDAARRVPGPGEQYPEVLLPDLQLRYPASRPSRGPPGPGPGARQGPPGRGLRHALDPPPGHEQLCPAAPAGVLPRGGRTLHRSRHGQAPPRPAPSGRGRKALKLTLLCDSPRDDENSGFARELGRQLEALEIKLDVRYLRRPEDGRAVRVPFLKFLAYTMDFPDPENIIVPLYYSGSPANA